MAETLSNFGEIARPETGEKNETSEKIVFSAKDVLEEQKAKLTEKLKKHEANLIGAGVLTFAAGLAYFGGDKNIIKQEFNELGASPKWTALLNSAILAYEFGLMANIESKLKKLRNAFEPK